MRFEILGPLQVHGEVGELPLRARPQRRVLAVLLSRADVPVSVEELIDALWPDSAPGNGVKNVQSYISRLKDQLAEPDRIVRGPAGYLLKVRPGELDAQEFVSFVDQARAARKAGEVDCAVGLLERALGLWRGDPYCGLGDNLFLASEVEHLHQLRFLALEDFADISLTLGRHVEVVLKLSARVAECPDRERLSELLMLALYRSDRQAEALKIYRRTRDTLVEEHGVEPGGKLRRLHEAILRRDPALDHHASQKLAEPGSELQAVHQAILDEDEQSAQETSRAKTGTHATTESDDQKAGGEHSVVPAGHRLGHRLLWRLSLLSSAIALLLAMILTLGALEYREPEQPRCTLPDRRIALPGRSDCDA